MINFFLTRSAATLTLAAGLHLGAAQALPISYDGKVAVGLGAVVSVAGAVTPTPASYQVQVGSDVAQSVSQAAAGGSVRSTTTAQLLLSSASTQLLYSVNLVGPAGPAVPVRVLASGFADGSGNHADASAYFLFDGLPQLRGFASYNGLSQVRAQFVIDTVLMLNPNTDYRVSLLATANAGSPFEHGPDFAEAFVDPQFIVDAAFASRYTMTGVPSVVPEPGSALLFLLGLAVLGAAWRRSLLAAVARSGRRLRVAASLPHLQNCAA